MILIISNSNDVSTIDVIQWLNYFQAPYFRINENDNIEIQNLEFNNSKIVKFNISINGQILDLLRVKTYWYRRGFLNYQFNFDKVKFSENVEIDYNIKKFQIGEIKNVINFIYKYLEINCKGINSFLSSKNDKTYYIYLAALSGLKIPNSKICSNKNELIQFLNTNRVLVTKSINEQLGFSINKISFFSETYLIDYEIINNCEDFFFSTLFQEYIEKRLELRIFFLNDICYSMAIFSQQNSNTKIDYRNYDLNLPNRNSPFKLPKEIENKIIHFMNHINLNCGSIDMILTEEGEYVFLEVNPIGQFGMVSSPCNYNLEMIIAKTLIK